MSSSRQGEREGEEENFNERKTKMKVLQNLTAISNHEIIKIATANFYLVSIAVYAIYHFFLLFLLWFFCTIKSA